MKTETVEEKKFDPALSYEIQQYQQTIEYKAVLLKAQYEKGLIEETEYQDKLNKLNTEGEKKRSDKKLEFTQKAQALANMGTDLVMSLMDLELEKAGENEEKKKQIRKKYADLQFVVTAAQIVANTAGAIMQGFAQLGPIGGAIAAVLLGATGLIQLGIANAQREKVKQMRKGKYPVYGEDDGQLYNTTFAGRPKTGIYSGPQLGIFNEDPNNPEMVVDGITTTKLQVNRPEIIRAIYSIARGGTGQYEEGKYPNLHDKISKLNGIPNLGGMLHGITGPLIDKAQNEILTALVLKVGNQINENTKALNTNTEISQKLVEWDPSISIQKFEKVQKEYKQMQKGSRM